MSVRSRRIAVAGAIAATMIAIPAAALASDAGTSSGKPPPSAAASESAAASKSAARQSGAVSSAPQPSMVDSLAAQLGVSHSAAQGALHQLDALGPGGGDPANPAFAAIAHNLGVSADRLTAALRAAKQAAGPAAQPSGAGK
jgi:hypothetical protein